METAFVARRLRRLPLVRLTGTQLQVLPQRSSDSVPTLAKAVLVRGFFTHGVGVAQ